MEEEVTCLCIRFRSQMIASNGKIVYYIFFSMNAHTAHPKSAKICSYISLYNDTYLMVLCNSHYTYAFMSPLNKLVLTLLGFQGPAIPREGTFQGVSQKYDEAFRYLI